ncbi:MAG: glucose-6-phosphate dehydrogenase assembly protein OpcA [Chloroflexia bacterium]
MDDQTKPAPIPATPPDPGLPTDLEGAGLQRELENVDLDSVAQADPTARPDRYSAEALQDIVHGGTIPVPVNSIDRELIQLWKSTTIGGDNEGKVSVTLMRVMNLVVYVEDEARAVSANAVIDQIVCRHPCRTIMITNVSGGTGQDQPPGPGAAIAADRELNAHLSAHCQLSDADGKQVCCEQITIHSETEPALSRVSNLALNLLITDLPVFLWWASGAPFNNMVLTHLEDSIDRLVVDSAGFADPIVGLTALARTLDPSFQHQTAVRHAPGDLNWGRLEGWREATAQIFDTPDYRASLWKIGSVEVQYAAPAEGAEPNPTQALLFAGWLASRMGWEFHGTMPGGVRGKPGDFMLTMRQGVRSIPLGLRATPGKADYPGGILGLRLTTNDPSPLTFGIRLDAEGLYLDCIVEREGQEPVLRKVRYSASDEAGLLDSELEEFGHDTVYEQALVMAGAMAWGSMTLGRRNEVSAQLGTENRQSSFDPRF